MSDTSRTDMSRLISRVSVFGEKGMKTCCDDANLSHVHKMSRMCPICIQKWISGQFVSLIGLIFVDSQYFHDKALKQYLR